MLPEVIFSNELPFQNLPSSLQTLITSFKALSIVDDCFNLYFNELNKLELTCFLAKLLSLAIQLSL